MNTNTKIINLLGGPGVGKSTTAAEVFSILKKRGVNIEYVTEYAKDKVYNGDLLTLDNQIKLFGEQFHRLWRLLDKVDYIITDSPLFLMSIYFEENFNRTNSKYFSESFKEKSIEYFDLVAKEFNNINFLIYTDCEYQETGRVHSKEQSQLIYSKIEQKMIDLSEEYLYSSSKNATNVVLDYLNNKQ